MQFSPSFILAVSLALANSVFAAENSTTSTEEEVGTSKGVQFPFSDDAILEAVDLGTDIAPIVLKDSVYFINTTIADADMSKLSKRDAEAWYWRHWYNGQPMYKRDAAPEASPKADADAWYWRHWYNGQPMYKREAAPEASPKADADAWYWRQWYNGQPMYKRDAAPKADADAWYWRQWYNGQPMY